MAPTEVPPNPSAEPRLAGHLFLRYKPFLGVVSLRRTLCQDRKPNQQSGGVSGGETRCYTPLLAQSPPPLRVSTTKLEAEMKLLTAQNYGLFLIAGALAYWLPDMLLHAISLPVPVGILALTFVVPAVTVGIYFWIRRRFPQHPRAVAFLMLLGVWAFGPLGLAIGMAPLGGTFLHAEKIGDFLWLWLMFPVSTFMMSTYSGSLAGVLLVTLALLICAVIGGRGLAASNHLMQPTGQERPAAD